MLEEKQNINTFFHKSKIKYEECGYGDYSLSKHSTTYISTGKLYQIKAVPESK